MEIFPSISIPSRSNDFLFLRVDGETSGDAVRARFTILQDPNDLRSLIPVDLELTIATGGTAQEVTQRAPNGWILGCTIFPTSGTPTATSLYAAAGIRTGGSGQGNESHVLVQGNITNERRLSFPWFVSSSRLSSGVGIPTNRVVPDPAQATDWSITVPAGETWKMTGLTFRYVADANAASRIPKLVVEKNSTDYLLGGTVTSLTANQDKTHITNYNNDDPAANNAITPLVYPITIILEAGDILKTDTSNMQVGDQISKILLFYDKFL